MTDRTPESTNAKSVLTDVIYDRRSFAEPLSAGSIELGHYKTSREDIYQMAPESSSRTKVVEVDIPKSMGQTYYEEVETLKSEGIKNADAVRQVAEQHGKNENAVRGGIHQYKSRHVDGKAPTTTRRATSRSASLSVDDYVANARKALESARGLIDQEVNEAKAALDAAQARYDEVQASVKDRQADIEKKIAALS